MTLLGIAKLIKHRLYTYFEFARYISSRICRDFRRKKVGPEADRESNYWGYISSLQGEKQKRCPHNLLRKVSRTKFYCQDCGAELRYIREEVSLVSEIVAVALSGFLIYRFLKGINSRR